ncbi:MAG: hypothetical protein JW727_02650 [Candidatus Aenigmarchaeota archaeon]|nr:hypothetical protein [Candidatus Aenigmarchaeota archaeon]
MVVPAAVSALTASAKALEWYNHKEGAVSGKGYSGAAANAPAAGYSTGGNKSAMSYASGLTSKVGNTVLKRPVQVAALVGGSLAALYLSKAVLGLDASDYLQKLPVPFLGGEDGLLDKTLDGFYAKGDELVEAGDKAIQKLGGYEELNPLEAAKSDPASTVLTRDDVLNDAILGVQENGFSDNMKSFLESQGYTPEQIDAMAADGIDTIEATRAVQSMDSSVYASVKSAMETARAAGDNVNAAGTAALEGASYDPFVLEAHPDLQHLDPQNIDAWRTKGEVIAGAVGAAGFGGYAVLKKKGQEQAQKPLGFA